MHGQDSVEKGLITKFREVDLGRHCVAKFSRRLGRSGGCEHWTDTVLSLYIYIFSFLPSFLSSNIFCLSVLSKYFLSWTQNSLPVSHESPGPPPWLAHWYVLSFYILSFLLSCFLFHNFFSVDLFIIAQILSLLYNLFATSRNLILFCLETNIFFFLTFSLTFSSKPRANILSMGLREIISDFITNIFFFCTLSSCPLPACRLVV